MKPMLCELCRNIDLDVAEAEGYPHHASGKAMVQAAADGCQLCNLFCEKWWQLEPLQNWPVPFHLRLNNFLYLELWSKSIIIEDGHVLPDPDNDANDELIIWFGLYPLDEDCEYVVPFGKSLTDKSEAGVNSSESRSSSNPIRLNVLTQ